MTITAGFLIVQTYERTYREYYRPADANQIVYSIPRKGIPPESNSRQYRGIYRQPLLAWYEEMRGAPGVVVPTNLTAAQAMRELEDRGTSNEDFIFEKDDALRIWGLLIDPEEWDLIWAANASTGVQPPEATQVLGYDPTWFTGDHFSAIADSMCFPLWHGTDEAGTLFKAYHERLNGNALFDSAEDALNFLNYYRSFDWTETGEYVIAEVRSVATTPAA